MTEPFHGAKIALLVDNQIVTILRDETPSIPWPGHWDLPGGGREGAETPVECALRELREELGLILDPASVNWLRRYPSPPGFVWFLVAELPLFDVAQESDFRPQRPPENVSPPQTGCIGKRNEKPKKPLITAESHLLLPPHNALEAFPRRPHKSLN